MSEDFEVWRKAAKRRRQSVPVCFDETIDPELEHVQQEMAAARKSGLLDDARGLAERERELLEARKEATRTLVFEGLGPGRLRTLLGEHAATEEAKNAGEVGQMLLPTGLVAYDRDTFPPVLMVECCIEPGLSVEQAEWLLSETTVATASEVWGACVSANIGQVTGPKAQSAIGRRLLAATSSTPPPSSESDDQSSSDGASEQTTSTLMDGT